MKVLTAADLIRRPIAEQEAARQYARAIERHFETAHALRHTDPAAAERIAKGAAALRMDARMEVRR